MGRLLPVWLVPVSPVWLCSVSADIGHKSLLGWTSEAPHLKQRWLDSVIQKTVKNKSQEVFVRWSGESSSPPSVYIEIAWKALPQTMPPGWVDFSDIVTPHKHAACHRGVMWQGTPDKRQKNDSSSDEFFIY